MKDKKFIKQFNHTGPCIIDIDELSKVWNYKFFLSQGSDDFKLIQYLRRGSIATQVKCSISNSQALEIIDKLKLVKTQKFFTSAASWRQEGFSEFDMLRKEKTTKIQE